MLFRLVLPLSCLRNPKRHPLNPVALRQGVFSHFLIRGLKGEADQDDDGIVRVQELYDFIYVNVRAYTGMRQSPVIKGDYDPLMPVGRRRR